MFMNQSEKWFDRLHWANRVIALDTCPNHIAKQRQLCMTTTAWSFHLFILFIDLNGTCLFCTPKHVQSLIKRSDKLKQKIGWAGISVSEPDFIRVNDPYETLNTRDNDWYPVFDTSKPHLFHRWHLPNHKDLCQSLLKDFKATRCDCCYISCHLHHYNYQCCVKRGLTWRCMTQPESIFKSCPLSNHHPAAEATRHMHLGKVMTGDKWEINNSSDPVHLNEQQCPINLHLTFTELICQDREPGGVSRAEHLSVGIIPSECDDSIMCNPPSVN